MTWIYYYLLFATQLKQTLFYMKFREMNFEQTVAVQGRASGNK